MGSTDGSVETPGRSVSGLTGVVLKQVVAAELLDCLILYQTWNIRTARSKVRLRKHTQAWDCCLIWPHAPRHRSCSSLPGCRCRRGWRMPWAWAASCSAVALASPAISYCDTTWRVDGAEQSSLGEFVAEIAKIVAVSGQHQPGPTKTSESRRDAPLLRRRFTPISGSARRKISRQWHSTLRRLHATGYSFGEPRSHGRYCRLYALDELQDPRRTPLKLCREIQATAPQG